jgi:plastocyanin
MVDMNVRRRLLPVLLAPLALVACGDGDDSATDGTSVSSTTVDESSSSDATAPPAATATDPASGDADADAAAAITIERSRFSIDEIRVPVGTTVVWENLDGYAHTVTSTDDAPVAFDSSGMAEGDRFEFTFDEPGTYAYFCQIHPTMRAVVIVE